MKKVNVKRITMGIAGVAFAIVLSAAMFAGRAYGAGGNIQVKGSDTMVNLGGAWAEAYMKKFPNSSVSVVGGGSGTGFAALINGTTDIAESSRKIEQKEVDAIKKNGKTPVETVVGYDGIAVVVNPKNPVKTLTIPQLSDIFTGKITNWKEVGGKDGKIVLLSREVNSGTHVYFKENVLNGGNAKGPKEFAPSALLMPSSQAIADEAATNKNAIGYFGMGYLSKKTKTIQVRKDASSPAVIPTLDNVLSNKYPISRSLYFYTAGKPSGDAAKFIKFVLSADGQKIVQDQGFVPMNMKKKAGKK